VCASWRTAGTGGARSGTLAPQGAPQDTRELVGMAVSLAPAGSPRMMACTALCVETYRLERHDWPITVSTELGWCMLQLAESF